MHKDQTRLRIGLLGCGPIAQAAHLDAIRKARNADLYAICDVAPDLTQRMAAIYEPSAVYTDFSRLLADDQVQAVVLAVADEFHVPLTIEALQAGKSVLVEKPLGTTIDEAEALRPFLAGSGLTLQIGNNRRFEPGMLSAHQFVRDELGVVMSLDAWYYDSAYRSTMQENLRPVVVESAYSRRPAPDWKAVRDRYLLLTHGAHLVDTARFLAGPIRAVNARHRARQHVHGWSVHVEFESGALGHLELISPRQGDFEEGFRMHGEHGSISGKALLPWFQRAEVECFKGGEYRRVLSADGYTFKRQIEGFADTILHGKPQLGANFDDGIAAVRALVAISHSVHTGQWVALDEVSGAVLSSEQGAMRCPSLRVVA
jgi:predicted dehydrogenase